VLPRICPPCRDFGSSRPPAGTASHPLPCEAGLHMGCSRRCRNRQRTGGSPVRTVRYESRPLPAPCALTSAEHPTSGF
jgi:hypothetical protein